MANLAPASGRHNKSTNGRLLAGARGPLALLSRLSPGLAALAVERLFFTPPRARRSRGEQLLRTAEPFRVRLNGRGIACWRWGRGPAVVLLHGWGGRAAQLTSFVPALRERGFSVVAFDAPGHGRSGRGLSSAPEFALALRAVAEGLPELHAVVAHSLGAVAAALAIRDGLRPARVVLLAPAGDPPDWFAWLSEHLALHPRVARLIRERSERRLRVRWDELRLRPLVAGFSAPLLVLHDREDPEVRFETGAAIAAAWPGAEFHETSGLGHNRLLRDRESIARVVDFVSRCAKLACGNCGAPSAGAERCEACALDRELFDRDCRA